MKIIFFCFCLTISSACSFDTTVPNDIDGGEEPTDAKPAINRGGGSTVFGTDVQASGGGGKRDAGSIFVPPWADAGAPQCVCAIQPLEQPPELCIAKVCYGETCLNTFELLYCFYTGRDPVPSF